jgi:predicted ester cyclase
MEGEMSDDLKERVRWANEEIINKGNLKVVRELFAEDYVLHAVGEDFRGHKFIEGLIAELTGAFPDLRVEVEPLVADADRITWLRTNRGTHKGNFMGVPPSGRNLTWRDMVVTRFARGKVAEEWVVSDFSARPPSS